MPSFLADGLNHTCPNVTALNLLPIGQLDCRHMADGMVALIILGLFPRGGRFRVQQKAKRRPAIGGDSVALWSVTDA
jgi:hypothetical protein